MPISKWAAGSPCCKPCEAGPCTTTFTVRVLCGTTGQPDVPVAISRGGVELGSCTTASNGECVIPGVEGTDPVTVAAGGASREVVPNCGSQLVQFAGQTCLTCFAAGPPTIELETPYGVVTLSKVTTFFGPAYDGQQTLPAVPNVAGVDCTPGGRFVLDCDESNLATRPVTLFYRVGCQGDNVITLLVSTFYCLRCTAFGAIVPGSRRVMSCVAGAELIPCQATGFVESKVTAIQNMSTDFIELGSCVPCEDAIEFALDYADVGGTESVVTARGLLP